MSDRLTALQRTALRIAADFGRVSMARRDGVDQHRPNVAGAATLQSLRARGFLAEVQGPRYMPTYELTDKGREALAEGGET